VVCGDAPFSNTHPCFFDFFRIMLGSRNGFSRIGSRRSVSTEETAPAFRRRLVRCAFLSYLCADWLEPPTRL
jgi:hypothetical protein